MPVAELPVPRRREVTVQPGPRAAAGQERRRERQIAFNTEHGIVPKSINKRIKDIIDGVYQPDVESAGQATGEPSKDYAAMDEKALAREIKRLEKEMMEAAKNLEFEKAAAARDELFRLRQRAFGADHH